MAHPFLFFYFLFLWWLDLEDLIWDMGAAEVLCPVRIHMVFIAVVRVWAMEEVCQCCKLKMLKFLPMAKWSYALFLCLSGSFGGSDVGGMYSSSYGSDYIPRGADVCSYPPPVVAKGFLTIDFCTVSYMFICCLYCRLVVALTHLFIPVVVLVAAVTWVVVVLDHTIEVSQTVVL